VVAAGKASPGMAAAAVGALKGRVAHGVVAVPRAPGALEKRATARVQQSGLVVVPAGHPLPDSGSLRAGRAAADLAHRLNHHDLVLALISGGGSAMLELPVSGVALGDLRRLNHLLLRSGLPIESVNLVRRTLSLIKAGGLARLFAPARVVGLILSDVAGGRLEAVASGPTILRRRPANRRQARATLQRAGLWSRVPASIRSVLSQPTAAKGRTAHRPRAANFLLGSNAEAVSAAALAARRMGLPTRVLTRRMRGEAREVGRRVGGWLRRSPRPACVVLGGETVVTVRGRGRGGRNQEVALAAALAMEGTAGAALLSAATDGIDGPTDAAGAIVTGETARSMRARGVDPAAALAANDSYHALKTVGALLHTGPTGTNVNDLVVGIVY
jgi:hydroxypyruvate reductase